MNIYCIGTPFQMVSAMEARHQFAADTNILIVRDTDASRTLHREQVSRLIQMQNWNEVIYWPKYQGSHLGRQLRNRKFLVELSTRFQCRPDALLIGGFRQSRNHYLRNAVDPMRTIVLDDGVATYKHIQRYISKNIFCPEFLNGSSKSISITRSIDRLLFGIKDRILDKPVDIFTCFDISQEEGMHATIIKHDFPYLKANGQKLEIDKSRVDYLGSPLSERGLISLADEIELICRTVRHYSASDLSFCYLAHRDDSEEKLAQIRLVATCVKQPDLPAEVFYLLQPNAPAIVASAVSTGLHNIFRIMPEIAAQLILIPPRLFKDGKHSSTEIRQRYQRIRNEYEAAGIMIMSSIADGWG